MKKKYTTIVKLLLISMCLFVLAPIYAQDIHISTQEDTVTFPFYFNALEQVTISIIATDSTVFDPYVELSIGGIRVAENDNNDQFHLNNAEELSPTDAQIILFPIPTTGQYDVIVSGVGASRNHFRILVETVYGSGFSPGTSPVGQLLFTSNRDGNNEIYMISVDGSDVRQLTNRPADAGSPNWSPDRTQIVFDSIQDNISEIYTMNADGSNIRQLTNYGLLSFNADWSPDGTEMIFHIGQYGERPALYKMNADGTNLRLLMSDSINSDWSPDGNQIVSGVVYNGQFEIFVMNADGTNVRNITNNPSSDSVPRWSPDGDQIAFYSDRDGIANIYVMNIDGSDVRRLTNSFAVIPVWSSDGNQIAFRTNEGIYVMNADGSDVRRLTNHTSDFPHDW